MTSMMKRAGTLVALPVFFLVSSQSGCFGGIAAAEASDAPAPAVPAPPAAAAPGTVPAGTTMMLSMDENLNSQTTPTGQSFSATLEADLVGQDGKVVIPKGNKVFGKILEAKAAGRVVGKPELDIAFTEIRVNGQLIPIQAQGVEASGKGSGRRTARQVGAGALLGAAFGGKKGAGRGAMVGGAAALLTRGSQISIAKGALLDVKLTAAVVSRVGTPAPAGGATPEKTPAPQAAPEANTQQKKQECIKKLMGQGFSADDAIATCGKG